MDSQASDLEDLRERIVKLEQQNGRFKRFGVAGLLSVALLLVMGQAPAKKVVEANKFILRDDSGRIRATLSGDEKTKTPTVQLTLLNTDGSEAVKIGSGFPALGGGSVTLSGDDGQHALLMSSLLSVSRDNAVTGVTIAQDGLVVRDSMGFEAALGGVNLVTPSTGETHKTSVASLVLFGKDNAVIWKAP